MYTHTYMNAYIHAYIQTYICTYMNLGPKHVSRNPPQTQCLNPAPAMTSKSLGLTVCLAPHNETSEGLLGGSWGLVSRVISTSIGLQVIRSIVTLIITLVTKSHEPLSRGPRLGCNEELNSLVLNVGT